MFEKVGELLQGAAILFNLASTYKLELLAQGLEMVVIEQLRQQTE